MVITTTSRAAIQSALQTEIQTYAYQLKFSRFKKAHKQFRRFGTAKELVEFFNTNETLRQAQGDRGENEIASPSSRNDGEGNGIVTPEPAAVQGRNDRQENQRHQLNQRTKDRLLHLLVSYYQKKPKTKGWMISLLLLAQWKQTEQTFYRFGFEQLNLVNPFDTFAPVYAGYIDAFLHVKQETPRKFSLHLKDHAEYLIRKELKECNRFTGELESDIPAQEQLPWQFEIDQMIEEWTIKGVLDKRQSELVIYRIVYEYSFKEMGKKFKASANTLKLQFHRAVEILKPYLAGKLFFR